MKRQFYTALFCSLTLFANSACSDDDTPATPNTPDKEQETNTDDPNKIGYDDGKTLKFNVKIAVDREGLEYNGHDVAWVKENMKKQWEEINQRFKDLDKDNKLERTYEFIPDLDDIVLYSKGDCDHWNVPNWLDEQGKLDKEKYHCMVTYDFFAEPGEGGGGCGGYEHMANILVIHALSDGDPSEYKYTDHFTRESRGVSSIVHELGHFRGNIDTYTHSVSKSQNKVCPDSAFTPIYGNMNTPYDDLDRPEGCRSYWNPYELKVLNATKASTEKQIIYITMRDYFADGIKIVPVEEDYKTPVTSGYTVKFYDASGHQVKTEVIKEFENQEGGPLEIDAYDLFWKNDRYTYPWTYYDMFFVEVDVESGSGHNVRKGYRFMPNYHVHEKGLDDKRNPDFEGRSIFTLKVPVREVQ